MILIKFVINLFYFVENNKPTSVFFYLYILQQCPIPSKQTGSFDWHFCGSINSGQALYAYLVNQLVNPLYSRNPRTSFLQTVKTQMKYSRMLHFIRVSTVCKGKKDL